MLAATAVSIQADVIFAFIAFVATNLFVEAFEFASYHLQKKFVYIAIRYIGLTSYKMVAEGGTAPPSVGKASNHVLYTTPRNKGRCGNTSPNAF